MVRVSGETGSFRSAPPRIPVAALVNTRTDDGSWQAHAIEVNLRNGGTTHPVLTMHCMTDGSYVEDSGEFIADGAAKHYVASDHLEHPAYRATHLPSPALSARRVSRGSAEQRGSCRARLLPNRTSQIQRKTLWTNSAARSTALARGHASHAKKSNVFTASANRHPLIKRL